MMNVSIPNVKVTKMAIDCVTTAARRRRCCFRRHCSVMNCASCAKRDATDCQRVYVELTTPSLGV